MDAAAEASKYVVGDAELLKLAAGLGRFGGWSVELCAHTVHWSDEVCGILDVPAGHQPTLEGTLQFAAPEFIPVVSDAFLRCARFGQPYDLQVQAITATGRRIWVRAIGQPCRDEHGCIVRVHGAFQDITPLVQVHEEKRLLAERLSVTLESMTEGLYVVDQEWRITYANSEAARVMGIRRGEAVGRILWDVFPEAVGTIFHREFERALCTHRPVEFESHYKPLDLWVQVRAYPSSFGLTVAFHDITKRRQAELEVRRLNAELEERVHVRTQALQEANRDLETFAYAVAHDLRTPLCAGKAFAQALLKLERGKLSADGDAHVQRIIESLRYMDDMTQALLGLAKLSSASLRREKVDLSVIAGKILRVHRVTEPSRDVQVSIERDLCIHADRVLITQVLLNLIGNAWKFTRHARPARIEVGAAPGPGGQRAIYVRDNGAGFDMAAAARLFDPFVRLHSPREYEGSGIGLATVHKIVARHGGTVWAEAATDRGACFYFTIPGNQHADIQEPPSGARSSVSLGQV